LVLVSSASSIWSIYQTQGGFEDAAGLMMPDVRVLGGSLTARPQMLPTIRRYAQTAHYSQMNSTDVFVQALTRPTSALGLRADV
jgi:hypothetical protein